MLRGVPGLRLLSVPARVGGVAANAWVRGRRPPVYPDVPAPRLSPRFLAKVALDEVVLALLKSPSRFPDGDALEQVAAALVAARDHYARAGWLTDPSGYHRAPAPPPVEALSIARRRSRGVVYEHLRWPSGFAPRPDEPGAAAWSDRPGIAQAHAYVLRHAEPGRPWVVCVHGLGTGVPIADFTAFDVAHLHAQGANVVLPVLPLHGPRKANPRRLDEFLTYDLQATIHAVAHAVWDVRTVLGWVRAQGGTRIGLHGVSLGAYITALLATLEDDLDFALCGVPLADVPSLYALHAPPRMRDRAVEVGLLGEVVHEAHRVISPLAAAPRLSRDRLAVYAGLGDRMTTPAQAHRLWLHWQQPVAHWYDGNHVGFTFDRRVRSFVRDQLDAWLAHPPMAAARSESATVRANH